MPPLARAGVLLFMPQPAVIMAYDHMVACYKVLTRQGETALVNPGDMERRVHRIGQKVLIEGSAVAASLVKLSSPWDPYPQAPLILPLFFFLQEA